MHLLHPLKFELFIPFFTDNHAIIYILNFKGFLLARYGLLYLNWGFFLAHFI